MEQNQIEHLKKLIASLAEWQLCMSYNDSYFGEPAGLVKSTSRELMKLIESASLDNSTPKSWRDPAKELPEVGQPCLFRYKHGIISGHFAGVDEYKQIIGRTYIWRDQTYIIYGWMPLDEANNWLAQSSAPATVEAERTTAPVSLTDDDLTQEFSLDAIIKGIRYADHGRHEGWQAELKEYIRIECNRAILAAAPAPIQKEPSIPATPDEVIAFIGSNFDASWTQGDKEGWRYKMSVHDLLSAFSDWRDSAPALSDVELKNPTLIAYVATDLDGHYDVGITPEQAKQRAGHGCDTVFPIYDIGDNATPPALAGSQVQAAGDVLAERERQKQQEGWTPEHDDQYVNDELSCAAACYTLANERATKDCIPGLWMWPDEWWKPTTERRNLVKAGALILAEIERLDRAAMREQQP